MLIALVEAPTPAPSNGPVARHPSVALPSQQTQERVDPQNRKKCGGEINLNEVTFAYSSRTSFPVLKNLTIYIPASETAFIIGGSGSGKSTIAQFLLRMYDIQGGAISLDDQDIQYLDTKWTRQQIGAVYQGAILFDMTAHDNIAMGLAGPGSKRKP